MTTPVRGDESVGAPEAVRSTGGPPESGGSASLLESALAVAVLAAMTVLPLAEMTGRRVVGHGFVPGAVPVVQHLTLWIAMLGAVLAAGAGKLLALSTERVVPQRARPAQRIFTAAVGAGITGTLTVASLDLVRIEWRAGGEVAWGIPVGVVLLAMPLALLALCVRLIAAAGTSARARLLAACGLVIPVAYWQLPALLEPGGLALGFGILLAATLLGMPIFAAIGGAATLLYLADGTPINAVPGETYSLTTNALLPAIPLFALGGYVLSAGQASRRLLRLFSALVGWVPGGLAAVTTLVLAFFTPLTGASGITIVSMGGLLLPVLDRAGYPRRSSLGLVTVSGSIGLLFFPSLPVILYGFYANQPMERLFVGGLVPGTLLVLAVAGWGAFCGRRAERRVFRWREARAAAWEAKWELLLPVVILGSFFAGLATLVEAAALSVLYALVVERFVHRELSWGELAASAVRCATLVGGFLIILGVALAFTGYLILAEVPLMAVDWVQAHISSPWVFLLALNALLIVVGALIDIYSAIIVVVPLVHPIAMAYGIDPTHLGILFLANMELGYLMPPMGENLFLSAYRFERPLGEIYRSTLPYVVILVALVLLITYVPALTLAPVRWLGL